MNPNKEHSTFHTDQNKWDRRDFENEEFDRIFNDNEERSSLMGHRSEEVDPEPVEEPPHEELLSRVHTDEELERVIKELLSNSQKIDARDISVSAREQTVTLSGTVKSQFERDYAVSIVKLIHGVGHINSEIVVKTTEGILPSDIGRKPH